VTEYQSHALLYEGGDAPSGPSLVVNEIFGPT
jgi:hypothetical protein